MNLDLEHVDGSGVPGIMSSSSLVRENCPEQEQCGPEDGYSVGKNPTYAHTGSVRLVCTGT